MVAVRPPNPAPLTAAGRSGEHGMHDLSSYGCRRPGAEACLDFEPGSQFACPRCGKLSPVHDTVDKKWRHLDFGQHRTELIARVPRTSCEGHGSLRAAVPWARPGSGLPPMMEAMVLLLDQQMSVSAAARHFGGHASERPKHDRSYIVTAILNG